MAMQRVILLSVFLQAFATVFWLSVRYEGADTTFYVQAWQVA